MSVSGGKADIDDEITQQKAPDDTGAFVSKKIQISAVLPAELAKAPARAEMRALIKILIAPMAYGGIGGDGGIRTLDTAFDRITV